MKKRKKLFLVIALLTASAVCVSIGLFIYMTRFAKTEIGAFDSENGDYQLVIYEAGEPDWAFGATHCEFVLLQESESISELSFDIMNDGCSADNDNFAVSWDTDRVTVVVSGEEQPDKEYNLYFDGKTAIGS